LPILLFAIRAVVSSTRGPQLRTGLSGVRLRKLLLGRRARTLLLGSFVVLENPPHPVAHALDSAASFASSCSASSAKMEERLELTKARDVQPAPQKALKPCVQSSVHALVTSHVVNIQAVISRTLRKLVRLTAKCTVTQSIIL